MSQEVETGEAPPRHRVHLAISPAWRAVEIGLVVVALALAVVLPVFVFGHSDALPPCSTTAPNRCVGYGKPYQAWVAVWVKPGVERRAVAEVRDLLESQPHVGPCVYLDQSQAYALARRILNSAASVLTVKSTPAVFQCPLGWGASGTALRAAMNRNPHVFDVRYAPTPLGRLGNGKAQHPPGG